MISWNFFSCSRADAESFLLVNPPGPDEGNIKAFGVGRRPPVVAELPPPPSCKLGSKLPLPTFKEGRGREGRLEGHAEVPELAPTDDDPAGSRPGILRAFILALISSVEFMFGLWP